MAKVQIAADRQVSDQLFSWLQEEEILHVTALLDTAIEEAERGEQLNYQLADIQFALEFIGRVREALHLTVRRPLRQLFAGKPTATLARLEQSLRGLPLEDLLKDVHTTSDQLADIEARRQQTRDAVAVLTPWRALQVTGKDLGGTSQVRHFLIILSSTDELALKRKLMAISTAVFQEVHKAVEKKRGQLYWEIIVSRDHETAVLKALDSVNAEMVQLPLMANTTVPQHLKSLNETLANLAKEEQKLLAAARRFLSLEREFHYAYDALLHRQERRGAEQAAARLSHVVVLAGWVPRFKLKDFTRRLYDTFAASSLEEVVPGPDEIPPVSFRNAKLVRPFEAVTDIFGKPKYTELDPAAPLSIFFLIAFGLALTDAGYGLVLMALTWAGERYFKLTRSTRKMVRLLFYAGASTTLFGVVTGGWFGINLDNLSGELRDILLAMKVLDPVSQPLTLLMVVLAFGVVQLLFAWVVRGYDHWRKADFVAVLFDDVAWIVMVVVLLLWGAAARGLALTAFERPLLLAALLSATVLILTQGRSHKNPFLKLGSGLLSLYGLVSFMSDTLSYSRLLALGLATGIIALVVNLIGSMVYQAIPIPVVGLVLAAAVLLVGHAFNLGINTLGAFIHSGRLQFVEFFPKFLEGGGKPYQPLGRVSKYIANPREFD